MKRSIFSEKLILLQAKRGSRDAFAQIYDWYVKRIYQFIYFKVNSREVAEDITQDVFLKFIKYLDENQNIKSLKALLYQIARNLVIDYYRLQQSAVSSTLELEEVEGSKDLNPDLKQELEDKIEIEFTLEVVRQSLNSIRQEYKEIILLRFIDELTHKEIAKILNKKEGHIRVLLHRAINELKSVLESDQQT